MLRLNVLCEVHEFLICALASSSSLLYYFELLNIQQFIHSTGGESFPDLLPIYPPFFPVQRLFNVI